jgi:hypothetical protein
LGTTTDKTMIGHASAWDSFLKACRYMHQLISSKESKTSMNMIPQKPLSNTTTSWSPPVESYRKFGEKLEFMNELVDTMASCKDMPVTLVDKKQMCVWLVPNNISSKLFIIVTCSALEQQKIMHLVAEKALVDFIDSPMSGCIVMKKIINGQYWHAHRKIRMEFKAYIDSKAYRYQLPTIVWDADLTWDDLDIVTPWIKKALMRRGANDVLTSKVMLNDNN